MLFESPRDLALEALSNWKDNTGDKTCCWFILSLLYYSLQSSSFEHGTVGSFQVYLVLKDPNEWLSLHSQFLLEKIVSLFFARVRGNDDGALPVSNLSGGAIDLPVAITNWDEVQLYLLPILPKSFQASIFYKIAEALNSPCALPLTALESTKYPQFLQNADRDITKLQPKKWSRHCVDFMRLLNSSNSSCCLHLFAADYWRALLNILLRYWVESSNETSIVSPVPVNTELLNAAAYVLQCVQILFELSNNGDLLRYWTPSFFLNVMLCAEVFFAIPHMKVPSIGVENAYNVPSDMTQQYLDVMKMSSDFDRNGFVLSVIDVVSLFIRSSDVQSNFFFAKMAFARSYNEVIISALIQFISKTLEAFIPISSPRMPLDRIR